MSTISLEGSIRSCKVDTAWANRLQSDRFLNPSQMLCPAWNGVDTAGRPVCADTYWVKTPGCNSANDRILVENAQRPQYSEYITIDAQGIRGDSGCKDKGFTNPDSVCHGKAMGDVHKYTGQFGYQSGFQQNIYPNCVSCKISPDGRAQQASKKRQQQYKQQSAKVMANRQASGSYYY